MAAEQSTPERKVKTLAIRLDLELHAQLTVIAQLRDNSVAEEIREALSTHVAAQAANGELAGSATSMLDEIEREAQARREALSTLFGSSDSGAGTRSRRAGGSKRGSSGSPADTD